MRTGRQCRGLGWDHPRVGGEKFISAPSCGPGTGSPPRGRGKAKDFGEQCRASRITPAWAEKRAGGAMKSPRNRDHPRMGGEKQMERQAGRLWVGSPPRGRGKARGPRFFDVVGGITPAWAGKSIPAIGVPGASMGSPPRGRGKDSGTVHGCGQLRITPAWAGKSREIPLHLRAAKDHPCVGGEKL